MFDIIGKRRWYFLFSAIITIPGLLFILLTPLTGAKEGLQFTIDYTGGTKWELKFENANVTPDQIVQVFADNGLPASVVVNERQVLRDQDVPDRPPAAGRLADARPDRATERRSEPQRRVSVRNGFSVSLRVAERRPGRRPRPRRALGLAQPLALAVAEPDTVGQPVAGRLGQPRRVGGRLALAVGRHRQHRPPDRRQARRDGHGARGRARARSPRRAR